MDNSKKLVDYAIVAMENAYCPYSNFPVGCAILLVDGNIVTGVNIENASFGATNCAERTAIFTAINQGYKKKDFLEIAVVSNLEREIPPCGVCRQVMVEFFEPQCKVHMANKNYNIITVDIKSIMPFSFSTKDLKESDV